MSQLVCSLCTKNFTTSKIYEGSDPKCGKCRVTNLVCNNSNVGPKQQVPKEPKLYCNNSNTGPRRVPKEPKQQVPKEPKQQETRVFKQESRNKIVESKQQTVNNNNLNLDTDQDYFEVVYASKGKFNLTQDAINCYNTFGGKLSLNNYDNQALRTDKILIAAVKFLGKKACENQTKLEIMQIPNEFINSFKIIKCNGFEKVEYQVGDLFQTDIEKMNPTLMTPHECQAYLMKMKILSKIQQ
ncbi:hypothetical protein Hokovirus_2_16 [Hokovirus HKV1]|uniref:Uncharacterized protein n=1 Tax=Hokovirus HKV1 TaxID=1977638 RepID=A0A1V0SFJ4_9VIRU|nr:hypothetical protein Hokovirus_2_16 [Hokovirus HKV1]